MSDAQPGVSIEKGPDGSVEEPDEPDAPTGLSRFVDGFLGEGTKIVTTAGAIGATVAGYSLVQQLGEGDPDPGDRWWIVAGIVAFGVGAALLVTIPIRLHAETRATLAEAIAVELRAQRAWPFGRKQWWRRRGGTQDVGSTTIVGRDVLLGHDTVEQFEGALVDALREARAYVEEGLEVPPGMFVRISTYAVQRRQAERSIAADSVKRTKHRVVWSAVLGFVLVAGGYGSTTYLTNQAQRQGEVEDTTAAAERSARRTQAAAAVERDKMELQARIARDAAVLEADLEDVAAGAVLPIVPSEVKVVFPDEDAAAAALGVAVSDLDPACWELGRTGRAYEITSSPSETSDAAVVLVLLETTSSDCGAVVAEVPPDLIEPVDLEVTEPTEPAATTTTAPG
jgi:hypothetical protein